jgi:hypothetical protein
MHEISETLRKLTKYVIEPKRLFKDRKSVLGTASRTLGDKTPLPNRLATLIIQSPSKAIISKVSNLHAAVFEKDGDAEVLDISHGDTCPSRDEGGGGRLVR